MDIMILIYCLVGAVIGGIVGVLVMYGKGNRYKTQTEMLEQEKNQLIVQINEKMANLSALSNERTSLLAEKASMSKEMENLQQAKNEQSLRLQELREQGEKLLAQQKEESERRIKETQEQYRQQIDASVESYEKRIENIKKHHEQQMIAFRDLQKEQMEQQMKLIREQMNSASEKILKERSEQLASTNQEQLAVILNPLRENIKQMKDAVEKSDREQTTTMERLDASIKENLKQAREVGERADKLANALTSENKTQGNFGELRLKQLLESMGLEEGIQYEEQSTMKDESGRTIYDDGHRLIPDVILHFPDNRDVIIDSKVSLSAFQDYYNAESEKDQELALRQHILSVRNHVNELSKKGYSKNIAENKRTLDFVMMYVFSESALQLAFTNAPTLWKEAYDKGVIIVGSQSLYMMLRILEMTWRQVRQVENQQEIMKTANMIVERVQLFYERFINVEEHLKKTQDAFDKVKILTKNDGSSIVTAASKLLKYGAQENPKKQKLPKVGTSDN